MVVPIENSANHKKIQVTTLRRVEKTRYSYGNNNDSWASATFPVKALSRLLSQKTCAYKKRHWFILSTICENAIQYNACWKLDALGSTYFIHCALLTSDSWTCMSNWASRFLAKFLYSVQYFPLWWKFYTISHSEAIPAKLITVKWDRPELAPP